MYHIILQQCASCAYALQRSALQAQKMKRAFVHFRAAVAQGQIHCLLVGRLMV